jgi:hypothetical protein
MYTGAIAVLTIEGRGRWERGLWKRGGRVERHIQIEQVRNIPRCK